jgi:hypothetical protein
MFSTRYLAYKLVLLRWNLVVLEINKIKNVIFKQLKQIILCLSTKITQWSKYPFMVWYFSLYSESTSYPLSPNFRKIIAFWNAHKLRPSVLPLRVASTRRWIWRTGGKKLTGKTEVIGEQDRQCTYNVPLWRVRVGAVENNNALCLYYWATCHC